MEGCRRGLSWGSTEGGVGHATARSRAPTRFHLLFLRGVPPSVAVAPGIKSHFLLEGEKTIALLISFSHRLPLVSIQFS